MNIGSSFYPNALTRQFSQLQDAQARAQEMLSTGRRFSEASDDPDAAIQVQKISLERYHLAGHSRRRDLAMRLNEVSQLSAEQARKMLANAAETIETAFTPGSEDVFTEGFQQQVDEFIAQGASYLNQEQDGRYLFGGSETARPPFLFERDEDDQLVRVTYVGNEEALDFPVGLDIRMDPTADPRSNQLWADWMNGLIDAKAAYLAGDQTAARAALDRAESAKDATTTSTSDLIGKALRLQTLDDWSRQADFQMANQEARLQEVDINAVALQFNELQRNYQASMQSGRMLMSLSLIDFL